MIYIANDIESAGSKLGRHSTLSIGAALITSKLISFDDYWRKELVFYAELIPDSFAFEIEAMRVGCSQLVCLETPKLTDPELDTNSFLFNPLKVLEFMQTTCEHPLQAMKRFGFWIESMRGPDPKNEVVGVTDTVFFDPGRLDLLFGIYHKKPSPYGYQGLDLDSLFRGFKRKERTSLKELGLTDPRTKPHRADQDAVFLAQIARVLLFEEMEWGN